MIFQLLQRKAGNAFGYAVWLTDIAATKPATKTHADQFTLIQTESKVSSKGHEKISG
jgi:hypothetical protein